MGSGLFGRAGAITALFTKREVENPPSAFLLHRFLASDQDYARVAGELAVDSKDDDLIFRTWQTILPRSSRAPYLSYVAPKALEDAGDLVERVMEVWNYNRQQAEEAVELADLAGEKEALAAHVGVDLSDG